jgi:tape measure domain-containing protein
MAKLKDLKVTIGLSKKGLTKLNGDLRRVKGNFRRNFGEIASLAGSLATAVGTALVAGLGTLIKKGAELQTLKVGFRSIMGGADEAAAMVDKLNKFTASTPFRLEEVSRSARQLIAVGVGVDDVTDRMRMLGDIAAASGNSISDIAAIFSKVQAKGKVDLESLNQLAERGIPIFDQLRNVTGDANMEFGAGSVKVSEFNAALEQMATAGGFADDAMANLSETVDGRLSTAMDNIGLALGEFAEKSGLLDALSNTLEDFTDQIKRMSATDDDLQKSREEVYDITVRLRDAHKGNIEALHEEAAAAKDVAFALKQDLGTESAARHFEGASAMYDRVLEAFSMAGTHLSTLPDAPAAAPVAAPKETLAEFKARFNAAAALREEQERLAETTFQNVVGAEDLAVATQGLRDAYGGFGAEIKEVALAEEELFEEDELERLQLGTTLIDRAAKVTLNLREVFEQTAQSIVMSAGMIAGAMIAGTASARDMGNMVLDTLAGLAVQVGQMAITTGLAIKGIKNALLTLNPIVAVAAGVALVALGSYVRASLAKKAEGVPQMAEGGMFTGPSLAMVGEGPGTSSINPEVVAPLDKLRDMMGGGNVTVTGRLDGRDILISSERAGFDRNRVRGF